MSSQYFLIFKAAKEYALPNQETYSTEDKPSNKIRINLRIHVTFSIASAKMKISLLPFFFNHTKYTYLKRRIN